MAGFQVNINVKLKNGFDPRLDQVALQTAEWAEQRLREISPVSKVSRRDKHLRDIWKATVEGTSLVLSNDAPYSGFVEYGTKKMEARPMAQVVAPQARDYYMRQLGRAFARTR